MPRLHGREISFCFMGKFAAFTLSNSVQMNLHFTLSSLRSLFDSLSQDLAKDLAILAREIHDVAGEGGPPNLTAERSVPVSAVTAHEKVNKLPQAGHLRNRDCRWYDKE